MIDPEPYRKELDHRRDQGLLRTLQRPNEVSVNLASNDYLGLSTHPALAEAHALGAAKWGNGSTGSRLLSGSPAVFAETEAKLAQWKGTEAALVFNSGYNANVSLVTTLCPEGSQVFLDRLDHASIYDGARMSGAKLIRFRHNDPDDLRRQLLANPGRSVIFTESVFSMDGDLAPLADYAAIAEETGTGLVVDEAHADGVFGPGGRGLVHALGLQGKVDVVMGTFGKALGCAGACVWASQTIVDTLVNFARPFIYSTALPPGVLASVSRAIDLLDEEPWRREKVLALATQLRQALAGNGFDTLLSRSQIIPIVLGDNQAALEASKALLQKGFWAAAIRPPTVPPGTSRLRVNLTANHTDDDVKRFVAALRECR